MTSTQPAEPKRTKTVAVRLTDQEHAAWVKAAHDDGRMQLGRWAREHIARSMHEEENADLINTLADFRSELLRIGNNLNQLTRKAHANTLKFPKHSATWRALSDNRKLLADIRDALNKVER